MLTLPRVRNTSGGRKRLLFYVGDSISRSQLPEVLDRGFAAIRPTGCIPLSELPPIPQGYGTGILLCRAVTGVDDGSLGSTITVRMLKELMQVVSHRVQF